MTTEETGPRPEIEALEELLARYGAERTRWPAPARLRFAPLLASDKEAQRLLREAGALDSILDKAPGPRLPAEALAERIVAAAVAESERRPTVLPRGRAVSGAPSRSVWRARDLMGATSWPAAALLAASLLIGAIAGTLGALDPALETFTEVGADDNAENELDLGRLAYGTDAADLYAEELL
jgi:hypothetical protein